MSAAIKVCKQLSSWQNVWRDSRVENALKHGLEISRPEISQWMLWWSGDLAEQVAEVYELRDAYLWSVICSLLVLLISVYFLYVALTYIRERQALRKDLKRLEEAVAAAEAYLAEAAEPEVEVQ